MKKQKEKEDVVDVVLGDFNPLKVHHIDPTTRMLARKNPFKLIIDQGVRFYEWPVGSGNLWWEDRKPAGRLGEDGRPVRGKAHESWVPPMTSDQSVSAKNATLEQENRKLQLELEAIKREQALSASHPPESKPAKKKDSKSDDEFKL